MELQDRASASAAADGPQKRGLRKRVLWLFFFLFCSALLSISQDSSTVTNYGFARQQTVVRESIALSPWDTAILEAKEQLSNANIHVDITEGYDIPACLRPNKKKTSALVKDLLKANPDATKSSTPLVPLPVVNVGMPKCGSSTLWKFFECTGRNTTHWADSKPMNFFQGLCMRDAVEVGLPPIETCGPYTDVFTEINVMEPFGSEFDPQTFIVKFHRNFYSNKYRNDCFFPQLSLLEEIHAENPTVTFVMNFRPIHDWVKSVSGYLKSLEYFQMCHLPNLPRGYPKDINNKTEVLSTMAEFLCSHVQHVRNFVNEHPSHALIELDLYDKNHSSEVLGALFPSLPGKKPSSQCWGHAHKSTDFKKRLESGNEATKTRKWAKNGQKRGQR